MRNYVKYLFLITIVFNFIACQPSTYFQIQHSSNPINSSYANHRQTDSLIRPYKEKLDQKMNEVLVISAEEFPKERGKPETKLGNLVADLSLKVAKEMYSYKDNDSIDFCLLNFGGLRTSLPKGEITRGKVFELMPFENELVVVTITQESYYEFIQYMKESGGQPIGGNIRFSHNEYPHRDDGVLIKNPDKVKILTTDYLANGGDNMNFFSAPIDLEPVGIKLRDAIIQYCISENNKGKQLVGKIDGRIGFEN